MNMTWCKVAVPAAALSMVLLGAPVSAVAATGPAQGEASGPAAGTPTTMPSTAVQKQGPNATSGTAAGAPGVEGKQGTESGAQPKTSTEAGQPATPKQ
jgi:hypothetical protein